MIFDLPTEAYRCFARKEVKYEDLVEFFQKLEYERIPSDSAPVYIDNWPDADKKQIIDAKFILKKDDFKICCVLVKSDNESDWKRIANRIIKSLNGDCLVLSHNPSHRKWIFSSLSQKYSDKFSETRNAPLEFVSEEQTIQQSFLEFFKKMTAEEDDVTTTIARKISDAFDNLAIKIHEELTVNVFEAIKTLSDGIIGDKNNNLKLNNKTLDDIREPIFILLYRLIFILYAEDRGIFPVKNLIYCEKFSLKWIKEKWLLKSTNAKLAEYQVQKRLQNLFRLIELGSEEVKEYAKEFDYSKEDFNMRSYYGRIFDRVINSKLESWKIPNKHLITTLELLTRTKDKKGNYFFLDYAALDTRQLGSVYEHLLEFHLEEKNNKIKSLPDPTKRKSSGSFYTPKYLVDYIVKETIEPYIQIIKKENNNVETQIEKILSLKIIDPAMGSGHFLVGAVEYVAKRLCQIEFEEITEQNYIERKRDVVRRCIYGVDVNPLAVELASLSLWLETLSSDKPLTFLSGHLKCGNSLLGENLESLYDPQQVLFSKNIKSHLKKAVTEFVIFESLEDDTDNAVKLKIDKYQKLISHGSSYYQLKGILDYKFAEKFGLEVGWRDLREKVGVESITFYASSDGKSVENLVDEHKFFHWNLEFPEVFYEKNGELKENPGFNVLISNPPWVSTRRIDKNQRDVFWKIYEKILKEEMNTYTLFFGRMEYLVEQNAKWGVITPSAWYTNKSFDKLRQWLFQKNSINTVVDFPYKLFPFDKVTVETSLIIGEKNFDAEHEITILKGEKKIIQQTKVITENLKQNSIKQIEILPPNFRFYPYQSNITKKLDKITKKLGDMIELHNPSSLDRKSRYPKTTRQYSKCVFSQEEINNDKRLSDICVPCIEGEDIQHFQILNSKKYTNEKWTTVDGSTRKLNIKTLRWMQEPKLVGQRITGHVFKRLIFAIDLSGLITMPSANLIILRDRHFLNKKQVLLKLNYVLGILNSKLINYYYVQKYSESNTNITSDVIETIPIPKDFDENISRNAVLLSNVKEQKQSKKNSALIIDLENKLDSLVYKLYGLNEAEIKEVESSSKGDFRR